MNLANPYWLDLTPELDGSITVIQTTTGQYPASQDHLHGDFNLGVHVNDDPKRVHGNRSQLLNLLQQDYPHLQRIHWLNQVHGNTVYHVTDAMPMTPVDADAQITTSRTTALAIMTADCVPVMISAKQANGEPLMAAIHAGWQGIAKGVIATTVQKMTHQLTLTNQNLDLAHSELQQMTADWQAWIGACIGQESYEVDSRVKDGVLSSLDVDDVTASRLFRANDHKPGHYCADLAYAAQLQLNACGITQVTQSRLNSHNDARFYSYRSQTQQGLPTTGRMATLIFCRC